MKEAWICPKCNIGVAPHCDACPQCTKPLDLQGAPIGYPPPYRVGDYPPPETITSAPTITTPYTILYDPNITVKWSIQ